MLGLKKKKQLNNYSEEYVGNEHRPSAMDESIGMLSEEDLLGLEDDVDDDYSLRSGGSNRQQTTKAAAVGSAFKEVQQSAKNETRNLRMWRTVVLLTLLAASITISALCYVYFRHQEENSFRTSYFHSADAIASASTFRANNVLGAFRSLSDTITTQATIENATFPFFTLPGFEVYGEQARGRSGVNAFAYTPMVTSANRQAWEQYSVDNQGWIEESRATASAAAAGSGNKASQKRRKRTLQEDTAAGGAGNITPFIWQRDENLVAIPSPSSADVYSPMWQTSPPPLDPAVINYNVLADPIPERIYQVMQLVREGVFSEVQDVSPLATMDLPPEDQELYDRDFVYWDEVINQTDDSPHSVLFQPVFERLANSSSEIVGVLHALIAWETYFVINNNPPPTTGTTTDGTVCVLENSCGQEFTYRFDGSQAIYVGEGDLHDPEFDHMRVVVDLTPFIRPDTTGSAEGHCSYTSSIYPSAAFAERYFTNNPTLVTLGTAFVFFVTLITMVIYDLLVRKRNSLIIDKAARSSALIASLFPKNVREQLLKEQEEKKRQEEMAQNTTATRLRAYLDDEEQQNKGEKDEENKSGEAAGFVGKPIADLFPETTILFADIAGFTAWSSQREPTQVFTLLETLYRAFDEIAKRRRVYKVETIGDCYVAVAGLPDPRRDHALVMARFARDCMSKMETLVKKLEVTLGPDTAELQLRAGLHSGPVTAGVLRGERSRFQLFGDTMNTASRMESTGQPSRIHISKDTADILVAAGKSQWMSQRQDRVTAKGKGEMTTFWLHSGRGSASGSSNHDMQASLPDITDSSDCSSSDDSDDIVYPMVSAKTSRLIDWNVEILMGLLKQIIARRQDTGSTSSVSIRAIETVPRDPSRMVLDEVKEIISLPEFKGIPTPVNVDSFELPAAAEAQLYEYVQTIAAMYRSNPFHCFEHASHVVMSVVKLMSRIVGTSDVDLGDEPDQSVVRVKAGEKKMHHQSYGITSDPLTQFACVFSALIHDVDHTGVPNTQLVKEKAPICARYRDRSVAEQNSVDLAWDLLMGDNFIDLRSTIYTTKEEFLRFRDLVVNSVMATDIMDKDLKQLRNKRWDVAFADDDSASCSPTDDVNRKATIVIEHLIQASDVSHTMQHWHVYRKWNERLFLEMLNAYRSGRAQKDPSEFWYQGEIGFFDFYIIPLAKKLKDCGVFGVSSDECLNYAMRNRHEWQVRGQEVVAELIKNTAKGGQERMEA